MTARYYVHAWGADKLPDIHGEFEEKPDLSQYPMQTVALLTPISHSQLMAVLEKQNAESK